MEKVLNIENRISDFEKRDLAIIELNKEFYIELQKQMQQIRNLFKGYIALGIVSPGNREMKKEKLMTREVFFQKLSIIENQFNLNKSLLSNQIDKFERKKIVEDFILKMFDLTATRWESILVTITLWRSKRFESCFESVDLMSQYAELEINQTDNWKEQVEDLLNKHIEMLDYQEQHLKNEESLLKELKLLLSMRTKLFQLADDTFLE